MLSWVGGEKSSDITTKSPINCCQYLAPRILGFVKRCPQHCRLLSGRSVLFISTVITRKNSSSNIIRNMSGIFEYSGEGNTDFSDCFILGTVARQLPGAVLQRSIEAPDFKKLYANYLYWMSKDCNLSSSRSSTLLTGTCKPLL